jgi:uncharacterized membrane protein YqhA
MRAILDRAKYVSLVGVISLLLAAVAAFGWGAAKTVKTILLIITSYGQDPYITVSLIELVDAFLIATALFIFAASMYRLFISDLALPNWMLANNLYELKDKLGGVIILVMAVKFLEHLVEWRDAYGTLLFAVAVAVVSAAIIAMSYFNEKDKHKS